VTSPKPPTMFDLFLSQAANACATDERPSWPRNPFPKGIRAGSATERVLNELRRVHPQHVEHGQLRFNLNASRGMVSWALRYLEGHGLVSRVHDPRNPHYRRWRAVL
jgi:hypothetical protein